jgi:hypothetical protein
MIIGIGMGSPAVTVAEFGRFGKVGINSASGLLRGSQKYHRNGGSLVRVCLSI